MKKIVAGAAALGVSALLAGSVVAANVNGDDFGSFNELTKDQLFTSGVPAYNIVVGSLGKTIDVVWAGNIAAAIGKQAYMSTGEAGTGSYTFNNVVVTVGTESSSVITGDGDLADNIDITQSPEPQKFNLTKSDYSKLYDDDITGKITGDNSYKIRETETLDANVGTLFSKNIEALMALVEKGDIVYKATFDGDGIPHSEAVGAHFTTGDSLDIKFMGEDYSIQSISTNGLKVTLVESGSKKSLTSGMELAVTGEDDTEYNIVIGQAYATGGSKYKMSMTLMKDGIQLKTGTFEVDEEVTFSGIDLKETISIIEILDDSSNNDLDLVTLSIGKGGLLELEDSKVLPGYKVGSKDLWKVTVDGNVDYVRSISVENQDARWYKEKVSDEYAGLLVGESITLPLGLGAIDFLGLTTEREHMFKVGNGQVSWSDNRGATTTVDFYYDDVADSSVSIDGQSYYFKVTDDKKISILKGDQSDDPEYPTYGDVNADEWTLVSLKSGVNVDVNYQMKLKENDLHLALSAGNGYTLGKNTGAKWELIGTRHGDYNVENMDEITADVNYFDGVDLTDNSEYTAVFKVTEESADFVYFFIDPYTEDLAVKDDYDTPINYYTQVVYTDDVNVSAATYNWKLDQDDSDNDMAAGYTNYGSYVEVDGSEGMMTVPEVKRKLQIFIGGGLGSSTELIGDTIELTTIGAIVEGDNGTQAQLDSYDITSGSVGVEGAVIPGIWNVNNDRLVWLDNEAPSSPLIIVGGYKVNSLAVGTYGLEDIVTVSGQYVAGIAENNNLI
ncbi:MAG: S-layer protein, partial [Candidatus Cloacimonetes bacterium]|nr:S-layer protein [Candidatus Cloacimonadota bacterium]